MVSILMDMFGRYKCFVNKDGQGMKIQKEDEDLIMYGFYLRRNRAWG